MRIEPSLWKPILLSDLITTWSMLLLLDSSRFKKLLKSDNDFTCL